MDVLAAVCEVGSYRGAAARCATTHKTVKRIVERYNAGGIVLAGKQREHNYDEVAEMIAARVAKTSGRISAKRLLPEARAAGYEGSARNFGRLVAQAKQAWRRGHHRGRRPGVWTPGDMLVIDWGVEGGLHVFCAVLAWSRIRFIRFAADEKATTTLALLAECFETLGGVPRTALADRMGCLKAGVVANVVVPTADYVRFATHCRFRPDFCHANDPESKGLVEHLVGDAKPGSSMSCAAAVITTLRRSRAGSGRSGWTPPWCGPISTRRGPDAEGRWSSPRRSPARPVRTPGAGLNYTDSADNRAREALGYSRNGGSTEVWPRRAQERPFTQLIG